MAFVLAALGAICVSVGIGGALVRLVMLIVKARSFHADLPDKRARLAHDRSVIRSGFGSLFGLLALALVGLVLLLIS
jgi:hypothetical protein